MDTIMNLLDADDSLIERKLSENDVIEELDLHVGDWMMVNNKLFRLELIEWGPIQTEVGEAQEIFLKIQAN